MLQNNQNVEVENIGIEPEHVLIPSSTPVSEPEHVSKSLQTPVSETPQVDDTVKLLIDETNNSPNEDLNNMVNLLLKFLKDDESLKKLSVEIDSKTKDILVSLLSSNPAFFNTIEESFLNIVKDNSINLNDIPSIMELLKKIYELLHNLKNKKLSTNDIADIASSILKFVIRILIDKNKTNSNELEQEFITNIEKLIDSASTLIKLVNLLKPQTTNCFFNLFNK